MKIIYNTLFIVIALFFSACEKLFIDPPADSPEAVFENLWNTFNEEYAPFEERNVDWQTAYNTFRPMISQSMTDDELFSVLSKMLAILDDGHVSLTAPGKMYSSPIESDVI